MPSNPDEALDSYDGDSLIFWNLDAGHYEPVSATNPLKLERVSANEYVVTAPDGTRYIYNGYPGARTADAGPRRPADHAD